MSLNAQRAIRRSRGAWLRGNLGTALKDLETALRAAPECLEVLYPMARVLAETDDRDRALAVLDAAQPLDASGYVGRVFGALVRYDYDERDAARSAVEGLENRSVLAASLLGLIDFEASGTDRLRIHRGAIWISEIAGRLLAVLEARLFRSGHEAAHRMHRKLFTDSGDTAAGAATEAPQVGAEVRLDESFSVAGDFWTALERAFVSADDRLVTQLYRRKDVPAKWRDVISGVLHGYSLIALGEPKRALEAARAVAREHPESAWAHYLLGLAHIALGDRRRAIYSFVRASQHADIDMHHVALQLADELKVLIELVD